MVLIIMGTGMLLTVPLVYMSKTATSMPQRWQAYDQCFLDALSCMEKTKSDIQSNFRSVYNASPLPKTRLKFVWFDTYTTNSIGASNPYSAPQGQSYSNSVFWVAIKNVRTSPSGTGRDVLLGVRCQQNGVIREIEEVVRFEPVRSRVFDYAYFINNFGWFWGNSIDAQGDIRANGNFSFGSYTPLVNGNPYASPNPDNGALGTIVGQAPTRWSLLNYYQNAPARARPGSPPATNAPSWPMGYDGNMTLYTNQPLLEMPFIGHISDYEWLATNNNGWIKQGTNTIVTGVYSGLGPSRVTNGADMGCLILDGSGTNPPIEIKGPVVVRGDVIIKGTFTGQGTIYAGRNIHIAGDIIASNAPAWPHPDTNATATATNSMSRDLLGLCAKGSTLMGNYTDPTWVAKVTPYLVPTFTKPYRIDATDTNIGYGTSYDGTNWWFNGRYADVDGGYRMNGTNQIQRRYYQSSIDTNVFRSLVQSTRISRIDAVLYNNHLVSGYVGTAAGITFNGSVVSRDEAIVYNNHVYLNWDIRLGSHAAEGINIWLPVSLASPSTIRFREP